MTQNFALLFSGTPSVGMNIRSALEHHDTYQKAFNYLIFSKVAAPHYLILAGTKGNEGVVITKDRYGAAYIDELTDDKWFVQVTN